jgi:hypothetical protein
VYDPYQVLNTTLALTQLLTRITGKTVALGIAGGFGLGVGGFKFGIGFSGGGSATIATDRSGNSAVVYGDQIQIPSSWRRSKERRRAAVLQQRRILAFKVLSRHRVSTN